MVLRDAPAKTVHEAEGDLGRDLPLLGQRLPLFQGRRIVAANIGFRANLEIRRQHRRGQREGQDKCDNGA